MQSFATVQDLANILQQPVKTVQGKLALEIASARITAACGTSFAYFDHDVVALDSYRCIVNLPGPPVLAVHGVRARDGDGSWASLPLGTMGYQVSGSQVEVWGPGLIEVTYTHGYAEVPADVRGCCLRLAAEHLAGPDGTTFERIDDYASRRPDPDKSAGAMMLAELACRYGHGRAYMLTVR